MFEQPQSRRKSSLLLTSIVMLMTIVPPAASAPPWFARTQAPTQPTSTTQPAPAEAAIDEAALNSAWDDLSAVEPLKAYQAACTLAAVPQQATELIAKRLNVSQVDAARVTKLIRDMDSDNYNTREAAKEELASMGDSIEGMLRQALKDKPSVEVASRINDLLKELSPQGSPETRRMPKLVRALEMINTPASRDLLTQISKGSTSGAPAAADALRRLSQPTSQPASMAGKTLLLAQYSAIVTPEMMEAILAQAAPVKIEGRNFAAFLCRASTLHSALAPVVPDREGRSGEMTTVSPFISWSRTESREMLSPHCDPFLRKSKGQGNTAQVVAVCQFTMMAKMGFWIDKDDAWLSIDSQLAKWSISWTGEKSSGESEGKIKLKTQCQPGQVLVLALDYGRHGEDQPHHLVILQTVPVPSNLAPYFEAQRANVALWIEKGYDGTLPLAQEGLAWNNMAAARKGEVNPNWVRTLPGGTQVRVAGVWNPSRHPFQMWDGDGNPIPCDPHTVGGMSGGLCVRLDARDNDKAKWKSMVTLSSDKIRESLEVGIGDGPWEADQTLKLSETISVSQVTCTLNEAKGFVRKGLFQQGAVLVRMTYQNDPDVEFAVGAIDKQGRLVLPKDLLNNCMWSREVKSPGQDRPFDQMFHAQLPVDESDVDHYVLLKRPRHWATFEGIAAEPKTTAAATKPASSASAP